MKLIDGSLGRTVLLYPKDKKPFVPNVPLRMETILDSQKFAYRMEVGGGHYNRDFGKAGPRRPKGDIYRDAFAGKLAEYGVYNYLFRMGIKLDAPPELWVGGKGTWEDVDLSLDYGRIRIAVKSTKHTNQLLMLESHKYTDDGLYIPSLSGIPFAYDAIFLVRVRGVDEWTVPEVEVTGFITRQDLQEIIRRGQKFEKGTILGGPLSVANYWERIKDLREPQTITKHV